MAKEEKTVGICWRHFHDPYVVPGCCSACEHCKKPILYGRMAEHVRETHPLPSRADPAGQQSEGAVHQLKRAS